MRIGGLATGMDIDELVNKLMTAERIPLTKMQQDRTTLTWTRDAFRDVNLKLTELDNMFLDMKLSKTYHSKTISSSNENAISATATAGASNGTYKISVSELATSEMTIGGELDIDPNEKLSDKGVKATHYTFTTYDKDGKPQEQGFDILPDDTLNTVLKRISEVDNNVRMFYDESSNRVVMETTRTGIYNTNGGSEVEFGGNDFFNEVLKLGTGNREKHVAAKNAVFTYNDNLEITSQNNNYTLNGITYNFKNTTTEPVLLTVDNDVDAAFDNIKNFVDKYNEVIDKLNGSQREEKYRNYKPLTDEQKKEMSEKEIELWEEKAKSGLLKGESIITNGMFSLRQSWYANVNADGKYKSITDIGITTTKSYLDGGKLEIDEKKLKEALREDPESVRKLFSNDEKGDSRGIVNRVQDSLSTIKSSIEDRAGNTYKTEENYTLGKRLKDLNKRISDFEKRLTNVETRYWNQFTAMEKAIQRMNEQSSYLTSQFSS